MTEVLLGTWSVLANPLRKPVPKVASMLYTVSMPDIGDAAGGGIELVMVRMHPVIGDVVQFILAEVELPGDDVLGKARGAGKVAVGGEIAGLVIGGQLHPIDFPL